MVVVLLLAFFVGATFLCWAAGESKILLLHHVPLSRSATCRQGGVSMPTTCIELGFGRGVCGCRHSSSASVLFLAQGRSTWQGWQPDVDARAIPAAFP